MPVPILKRLSIKEGNLIYDLELKSAVIAIFDGTGKSFFCKAVEKYINAGMIKNAYVLDSSMHTSEARRILFDSRGSLIIIDDADQTLRPYRRGNGVLPPLNGTNQYIMISENEQFYYHQLAVPAAMKAASCMDGTVLRTLEYWRKII